MTPSCAIVAAEGQAVTTGIKCPTPYQLYVPRGNKQAVCAAASLFISHLFTVTAHGERYSCGDGTRAMTTHCTLVMLGKLMPVVTARPSATTIARLGVIAVRRVLH